MRRFLLLSSLLLFVGCRLFAVGFNVLIYPKNNQILDELSVMAQTRILDENDLSYLRTKESLNHQKSTGEKLSKSYGEEDKDKIEIALSEYFNSSYTPEISESIEVTYSTTDEKINVDAIIGSDGYYTSFICGNNDCDLFIIPLIEKDNGLFRKRVFVYARAVNSITKVYEALDGSATFDEKTIHQLADFISNGYEPEELKTERSFFEDRVSLDSFPKAAVYLNGNKIGETPIELISLTLPTALRLEAEGYSPKTISVTGKSELSIGLKPQWMQDQELYRKAKNGFYYDFARTVIMFGVKLATSALDNGSNQFLDTCNTVMTGALTISIVDLVGSLIGYYRQSEYISP